MTPDQLAELRYARDADLDAARELREFPGSIDAHNRAIATERTTRRLLHQHADALLAAAEAAERYRAALESAKNHLSLIRFRGVGNGPGQLSQTELDQVIYRAADALEE
jgi:hypothetical protein